MKFLKIFFSLILIISLYSCGSDDDICTSGEATPRLKIKFKTQSSGKLKTMDSLYVDVDYGTETRNLITQALVDSVTIPIRVDENPYTDIYVRTTNKGLKSKIRVNYTTTSQYVSPACGIKKLYQNVSKELLTPNPVLDIEQTQNEILNENKTTFYLLF